MGLTLGAGLVGRVNSSSFDMSKENLSLWLAPDGLAGTGVTFSWAQKASAGTSGSNESLIHNSAWGDTVNQPSTSLDGYDSAIWEMPNYPRVSTIVNQFHPTFLESAILSGNSYTAAYVIQPLSSNTYNLDVGGKVNNQNPTILGDENGYLLHAIMDDAGTCKIGAYHYDGNIGGSGTSPVIWPGGFGTWGLVWFVYTLGIGIKIRVQKTNYVDEFIEMSASIGDSIAIMGSTGGGGFTPSFRLIEALMWPGQALTAERIIEVEQGHFGPRYPSLGL